MSWLYVYMLVNHQHRRCHSQGTHNFHHSSPSLVAMRSIALRTLVTWLATKTPFQSMEYPRQVSRHRSIWNKSILGRSDFQGSSAFTRKSIILRGGSSCPSKFIDVDGPCRYSTPTFRPRQHPTGLVWATCRRWYPALDTPSPPPWEG